jgi:hypothetical protein
MKRFKFASVVFLSFILLSSTIFVYGANMLKTISVAYRNITIQINGKLIPSEQEPFIYAGRTFVPLRTIGDAFNKKVDWDNSKNQITISDPEAEILRLDSYTSLLNYFPDHFKISKSEQKLTNDQLRAVQSYLEKVFKNLKEKETVPDLTKEKISSLSLEKDSLKMDLFLVGNTLIIRYPNQSLYFINYIFGNMLPMGCSDNWYVQRESPFHDDKNVRLYNGYLDYINYSILFDKPNRTTQITDLYVTYIWVIQKGLYKEFYK